MITLPNGISLTRRVYRGMVALRDRIFGLISSESGDYFVASENLESIKQEEE